MRKILVYPNEVLRKKAQTVEKIDNKLLKDIADLKKVLMNCENGAGLAATQIGIGKRFFGVKDSKTKTVKIYINPKIEKVFGEKTYPQIKKDDGSFEDFLEGCLSFPGLFGTVRRYLKIRVSYGELIGEKLELKTEELIGFQAIVFQHERDHLDGVVFIDHIKEEKGKLYKWEGEEKIKYQISKIKDIKY